MIPQFPHYRVVARQKDAPNDYSLFVFPSISLILGILLGLLLSKCCFHHK